MIKEEWLEMFSDNLNELIKERGYNLQDLADDSGISRTALFYYLNGERMPGIQAVVNLVYTLDCNIYDLIDCSDRIDG